MSYDSSPENLCVVNYLNLIVGFLELADEFDKIIGLIGQLGGESGDKFSAT